MFDLFVLSFHNSPHGGAQCLIPHSFKGLYVYMQIRLKVLGESLQLKRDNRLKSKILQSAFVSRLLVLYGLIFGESLANASLGLAQSKPQILPKTTNDAMGHVLPESQFVENFRSPGIDTCNKQLREASSKRLLSFEQHLLPTSTRQSTHAVSDVFRFPKREGSATTPLPRTFATGNKMLFHQLPSLVITTFRRQDGTMAPTTFALASFHTNAT